jgi:hypothetical protein
MTYADLYQILIEAEHRVKEYKGTEFDEVAQRSQETVSLCLQRCAMEGITRLELQLMAMGQNNKAA